VTDAALHRQYDDLMAEIHRTPGDEDAQDLAISNASRESVRTYVPPSQYVPLKETRRG